MAFVLHMTVFGQMLNQYTNGLSDAHCGLGLPPDRGIHAHKACGVWGKSKQTNEMKYNKNRQHEVTRWAQGQDL